MAPVTDKPDIDSPVFRRADQVALHVRQPDSPWSLALGLATCAVLGIIVFATLSAGRQARADGTAAENVAPAAAPAPAPPAVPVAAQAAPPPAAPPPAPAVPASSDASLALHSPVMVVDQSSATPAPGPAIPPGVAPPVGGETQGSAEERFEAEVAGGSVETARASRLTDLKHTIPQGTMIAAVLETAINTDLPGGVRAVVARDVTGFDGSQVLIPRGSKLIGQYRSGMAYGQSRAFVVWSRILTPDGVSVDVGSPATDQLGRGGLAGKVDTHFFERFGSSLMLSVISAGAAAATLAGGANTAVFIGSPVQAGALAAQPQTGNIPVTIKVAQGAPVQVFLTRDLDFSGVAAR
jgi:type IV secretory pathway VirB10-like protein